MSRHENVHPAFRGILNAIAPPAEALPAGPLEPAVPLSRSFAEAVTSPAKAAYQRLVDELAANVNPDIGLYDVKQLRPLSSHEKAIVLRANPDCLNDIQVLGDELAEIYDGNLDPRLWLMATVEPLVRKWLFDDVRKEIAKDEEILRASAFDAEEPVLIQGEDSRFGAEELL